MKMDKFGMMFFVIAVSILYISANTFAQVYSEECLDCSVCEVFEELKQECIDVYNTCVNNHLPDHICDNISEYCEGKLEDTIVSCKKICTDDCNEQETCNGGAPDGNCDTGENCPADASACDDKICYEPVCTNGCVDVPVSSGSTDEACTDTEGCTTPPCSCDGDGNCIEGQAQTPQCANSACEAANTVLPCQCGTKEATISEPFCCAADDAVFSQELNCKASASCDGGQTPGCEIKRTFNKEVFCEDEVLLITLEFLENGDLRDPDPAKFTANLKMPGEDEDVTGDFKK